VRKLAFFVLLLFIFSPLWAMPPMPGSGLTHDGSIREVDECPSAFLSPALSSDEMMTRSAKTPVSVSSTGNKKVLVILAQFPDLPFNYGTSAGTKVHNNPSYYSDLLQGGSGFTMKQYYLDQSRNKLNLSFEFLGPYTTDLNYAEYGSNNSLGNDSNAYTLAKEMLNKAAAALAPPEPSHGLDGCTVIIVHSGPGEEAGKNNPPLYAAAADCIWSHRDKLSKHSISPITVNGTVYDSYLIVPEYNYFKGSFEATIGVFCHEFGHVIGLPDAYDTSYATTGVGQWSLMGGGSWGSIGRAGVPSGSDPAPFMAWERLALGWISEEEIELESGGTKTISFSNINSSDKVYSVKLTDNQYLLFEGKAKNDTGSGMYVMESGLMITQIHKGILDSDYWTRNMINYGSYKPHGAMVVEAKAANYKENGLGNLWRSPTPDSNRFTKEALFRGDTLTSVSPAANVATASGFLIAILAAWYRGRKKLCAVLTAIAFVTLILTGCVISSESGGGGTYDTGPNTNYYTSMTNVHSKTGLSGITVYNIRCNEDGSGSFTIKKD
jgi:M6 family metalloprotease-like protein